MTFFAEAPACGSRGQAKTACPPPPQAQLLLPKNRTHRLLHKPDNFRSSQHSIGGVAASKSLASYPRAWLCDALAAGV
jgi:hypothetical protein